MTNLRLKDSKFGRYVNTPKSQEFTFEESTPFSGPLVQLEDNNQQLTTSILLGKIIGVQSATRNLCISCYKKVTQKPGSKVAICQGQGCKLMQKVSSWKCNWHVKLLLETEDLKKIRLTIFNNQCLQKLLNVELFTCDISSIAEDDLVITLLGFESAYKITNDNIENTVLDIEFHKL